MNPKIQKSIPRKWRKN